MTDRELYRDWLGTNEDYAALISRAAAAAERKGDNVHYRHWLNVDRWRSMSRVTDPKTGRLVILPEAMDFVGRIVAERCRRTCWDQHRRSG